MDSSAPNDAERLLEHADWLRRLARRLATDAHTADDLAQETWLASLSAPHTRARSLRAYLGGILRNRVRMGRRREARRASRELAAAQREAAVPAADEALERAELARALVESVLALEEPFRSAVLLRYGEGLSALDAAQRLGVPQKTVESRVRRGLSRLRERWTRAHRGAHAWAPALARLAAAPGSRPVPAPAPTVAQAAPTLTLGTFGVLLMQTKLVLVLLAVATGAGALLWWNRGTADSARPAVVAAPERVARAIGMSEALSAPISSAEGAAQRAAVEPASAAPASVPDAVAPPAPARRLRGRVFDVDARPAPGVVVGLAPGGSAYFGVAPPPASATSGPDGVFELEASGPLHGDLRALDPELETLIASSVEAVGAGAGELVLVVARHRVLAGRVVDERGVPVPGARVFFELPPGFDTRFDAILDQTRLHLESATADAAGRFELPRAALVPGASLSALQDGFAPALAAAPDGPALELVLVLRRPELEPDVLAGRVLDEHGLAAAGAWVTLGAHCAVTDPAGSFRLARAGAEDARELSALLRGHRPGRVRAELDPLTGTPRWPDWIEVRLEGAPLALRGVVVDEGGEPRPGVSVWVEDPTPFGVLSADVGGHVEYLLGHEAGPESEPGDVYWFSTATDGAGRFELAGLLARDYTLRLFDGRRLETALAGPYAAGDSAARVVFPRGPLQALAGRVLARSGAPLAGIEVRLLGATYGGIWNHHPGGPTRTDEQGRFALPAVGNADLMVALSGEGIVPAWHAVELGAELVLEAVALLHAKVELADPGRASAFHVLDAAGAELELYEIGVGGVKRVRSVELIEGRSRALGFPEHAAWLVLEQDGLEVDRAPLALEPGRLNLLRR